MCSGTVHSDQCVEKRCSKFTLTITQWYSPKGESQPLSNCCFVPIICTVMPCVRDGDLYHHSVIITHRWIPIHPWGLFACLPVLSTIASCVGDYTHPHPVVLTHRWIPTLLSELSVWSPCPLWCSTLCRGRWHVPSPCDTQPQVNPYPSLRAVCLVSLSSLL